MPMPERFALVWSIHRVHRCAFVGWGRNFGLASLPAPQLGYKRPLHALSLALEDSPTRLMCANRSSSLGYHVPVWFAKEFL